MSESEIAIPDWIRDTERLAAFMLEMAVAYTETRWRYMDDLAYKPDFIAKAMGNPLTTLPTLFLVEDKRREAKGLGKFLDAVHLEMRNLAREVGKKFLPELQKVGITEVPAPKCPFASQIKQLDGINSAAVELTIGSRTITIDVTGDSIGKHALSILAASRAILRRPEAERVIVQNITGSIDMAYKSVVNLSGILIAAIKKQHPEYENLSANDFGLDIAHKPLLAKKAEEALLHARTAFNFFRCAIEDPLQHFTRWVSCPDIDDAAQMIHTSSPQDICAAFYGCGYAVLDTNPQALNAEYIFQITKRLEESKTLRQSAEILKEPSVSSALEQMRKYTIMQGRIYAAQALNNLFDFRDLELGAERHT